MGYRINLDNLESLLGPMIVSLAFGGMILAGVEIDKRDKKFHDIVNEANTDKDCIITHEEWKKVYNNLGKPYDPHFSDPREDLGFNKRRWINLYKD